MDPTIKQLLQDMKEASCSAYEICKDRTEPLGVTSNTGVVQLSLAVIEAKSTRLLDPTIEPTFNPPDAGSDYTPIDMANATLGMYANNTKQELCNALEEYCGGDTQGAARHVRRAIDILGGYVKALGAA